MEKIMDINRRFILILAGMFLIAMLVACGKSGVPQPPGGVQEFHWTWTRAEITNGCLSIQGGMEGNMDNFYEAVLELQPSDMDDFCVGCPFLPVERESFSRHSAEFKVEQIVNDRGETVQSASVNIFYCPDRKAPSYQWRLLGVNVNQLMPHALTPIQYLSSPLF